MAPDGGLDVVEQVTGPQHLVPRSWAQGHAITVDDIDAALRQRV